MTGSKHDVEDAMLETLFEEMRQEAPAPSDTLLARIAEDAAALQPMPGHAPDAAPAGWLRQMIDGIGGWPALGGLVTATVAGVYIGVSQPELVGLLPGESDTQDLVSTDLLPGDDFFFGEG